MKCSDGRTIRSGAFKHNDGRTVPLVWNHRHAEPIDVLGHALLENREEGVYAYGTFNNTENGRLAKELVLSGDITALSIYANQLKQQGGNVMHGEIREVSLVHAGANPGAYIESVIKHSDDGSDPIVLEDEGVIFTGESISLYHAEEPPKEEEKVAENQEKTVKDVFDSMTEEQKTVVYAMIGQALEDAGADNDDNDEEETEVKHNVFDKDEAQKGNYLSHGDQEAIIAMAKQSNVGSLKQAINLFLEQNDIIQHSEDGFGVFEDYGVLFPELELLNKGEPETLYKYDQSWVMPALNKIHKSPFSRIRTRHADARLAELKAKGYQKKGDQKTIMGQITMINRETTPQTIYIKDNLHRDDIVDIKDFDIVAYQWAQMRRILVETIVLSAMVGDGRELDDPDKIKEEHIRPIWKDNDEYTIHVDVDIEAARKELQGTETGAHFGDNYIYNEAIITAALYAREHFKGTGTPDFYCTPHLVNVMLLARDLNGRRIYDSKADLAKALNCNSIVEVEHFEGLTRTTEGGDKKKLLGLFVNLNDYTFGSTRGGEITKFEDFDMDFNLKKFMLETRLSGSLYKLKSAIALEEPVAGA
jgi:HK97 family phage prohead protease